jgi:succinate dehydrogenase/fumarate reductase cytochrome b subunit
MVHWSRTLFNSSTLPQVNFARRLHRWSGSLSVIFLAGTFSLVMWTGYAMRHLSELERISGSVLLVFSAGFLIVAT